MNIVKIKVEDLIPYINNPRNNENAVDKVASSIAEFGFKNPIVIDKNNVVINGHTRLLASKKLGLKEVPCIVADDLTEAQVKAFRIADNKTSEYAEWNEELLKIELEQLEDMNFNLDELSIDYSDFNMEVELDNFEDEYDEEGDIIEEPPKVPFSKQQDIWLLGKHRLMCGDSTSEEDVAKLMNGVKADMVFTDPPYGVNYEGINNDNRDGLDNLLDKAFNNMMINSNEGSSVYCFHSDRCADIFNDVFRKYCHFSSMIIWKKQSLVLSQTDYQSIHEPCMYGWFNNGKHNFYGDRKQISVWEYERETIEGHTTPKPVKLICNALNNSSKKENKVLDLFGGSGSTMIASDILNRINYSMELDEKYVDVIVKRYINHKQNNGEDVYLLRDGNKIPYSEIEEEFNKEAE